MNLSKEIKVGLLVTITLVTVYTGFNYLKGKEIFPTTNVYYAFYKDARGLNKANEVMLNGYKVGRIQRVDILPKENYKVLVTLCVDKNIKLTHTSMAKLNNSNLLGGKVIDLFIKEGNLLQNYDTLLSETGQDFQTIFTESTLPTLNDARSITLLTNKFMENLVENTDRINTIFSNLEETSAQLQKAVAINQKYLSIISHNVAKVSSSLSDEGIGIEVLLTRLNHITHEIEAIKINDLAAKLNNILTRVDNGEVYNHIDRALVDLDSLLVDMRVRPSRYVHFSIFGSNSIFNRSQKKSVSLYKK